LSEPTDGRHRRRAISGSGSTRREWTRDQWTPPETSTRHGYASNDGGHDPRCHLDPRHPCANTSPIGLGGNGSLQAVRSSSLSRSGSCIRPALHWRRHTSNNSGHDPRCHLNPRCHFDPHHPCIMSGARVFDDPFARSSSGPSPTTNPIGVL
jgi:hypothetical protein